MIKIVFSLSGYVPLYSDPDLVNYWNNEVLLYMRSGCRDQEVH